ncbi:hypothetical protein [Azospirillum sp. TSH64]|uniref:hypothetical protein n=1 Tax=Azospirillum sp. TSH64 TaxID=652740 RepID=UPI0011B1D460|nr:hypothetical protein [Azospirillum sp. TSH64]
MPPIIAVMGGQVWIMNRPSGIGSLLIGLNPSLAERIGPLGLGTVCGAIVATAGQAIVWGFAHAGILEGSRWFLGFPVLIGAYCGALNGWKGWRQSFDGTSRF